MNQSLVLSHQRLRNKIYQLFLRSCARQQKTVQDIIRFGTRLMWWSRIHPHFFGSNMLRETAEFLTLYALQLPREYQNPAYLKIKLSCMDAEKIISLFERRIAERIPIEYITQEAEYLGHTFYVNEHVLIPRSLMNTRFHDFLNEMDWQQYRVLDLCTGSGCIGISLALMHPGITVDLADISKDALSVAEINIKKYQLQDRVRCIQSDVFSNIKDQYDLIITNPPYVSRAEYKKCPLEFKREPHIALEAGKEGLDIIHRILREAKNYLHPRGKIIAEVGMPTAKRMKRRYKNIRFQWYKYRTPAGKVSWFISPGIFAVKAVDLPDI